MKYRVLVITKQEAAFGFRLTGAKTYSVSNQFEAKERLEEYLASKEYGIILIDEAFVQKFDEKIKKKIFNSTYPLIVYIPMLRDLNKIIPEDTFMKFISNAIGYQIRI